MSGRPDQQQIHVSDLGGGLRGTPDHRLRTRLARTGSDGLRDLRGISPI
ncbi:hypothetical protein SDC9_107429 [bioreactor metagenome]|uniref:Uncharacterized protein n=1 Tax=bioreactor metagenome TaxID=1076179 RepID=A0A645B5A5_9ZZZZ